LPDSAKAVVKTAC